MADNRKKLNEVNEEIVPEDIIKAYMGLCVLGTAAGTYLGGIVGLGVTAFSPAIVSYGLFKVARKALRR
jgi:hypothetical protein